MGKLSGKIAVVTGSSRGIGKSIALNFAREGADVVVNYLRNREEAVKVAKEIKSLGKQTLLVCGDVSNKLDVDRMVEVTLDKFSKIDILVNNAGIALTRHLEDLSEEEWDRVVDTNLKGVFLCTQAFGKAMIKQKQGIIINISSILGKLTIPHSAPYCAAKAGVIALTKAAAIEWAKYNIRVNAIGPGFVRTDLVEELLAKGIRSKEEQAKIEARTPMGRKGKPEEIAAMAVVLVSDDSRFMTGETIYVDGGYSAYNYI